MTTEIVTSCISCTTPSNLWATLALLALGAAVALQSERRKMRSARSSAGRIQLIIATPEPKRAEVREHQDPRPAGRLLKRLCALCSPPAAPVCSQRGRDNQRTACGQQGGPRIRALPT